MIATAMTASSASNRGTFLITPIPVRFRAATRWRHSGTAAILAAVMVQTAPVHGQSLGHLLYDIAGRIISGAAGGVWSGAISDRILQANQAGMGPRCEVSYEWSGHRGYEYTAQVIDGTVRSWWSYLERISHFTVQGQRQYAYYRQWVSSGIVTDRLDGAFAPSNTGRFRTECRQGGGGTMFVQRLDYLTTCDLFLFAQNFDTQGFRGATVDYRWTEHAIPAGCPGESPEPEVVRGGSANVGWNRYYRIPYPSTGFAFDGLEMWAGQFWR